MVRSRGRGVAREGGVEAVGVVARKALAGTHSLRIGGAAELLEAGASPLAIQTVGRWAPDVHRVFVRVCRDKVLGVVNAAGRVDITLVIPPAIAL